MLTLGEALVACLLCGGGAYMYTAMQVRELALAEARRACKEAGVQLLDQTVSFKRLSLSRDPRGHWRLWREYRFEFSVEGHERERGHVIMLGNRLQALVMTEPVRH